MKTKLAVLLLWHKNPEQINLLLEAFRHPQIDIFIHIDAKSKVIRKEKGRFSSI